MLKTADLRNFSKQRSPVRINLSKNPKPLSSRSFSLRAQRGNFASSTRMQSFNSIKRGMRFVRPNPSSFNQKRHCSTGEAMSDEVDFLVVGGGPSGLSSAIKLKQLAQQKNKEIRVCLIEKGPEIGKYRNSVLRF